MRLSGLKASGAGVLFARNASRSLLTSRCSSDLCRLSSSALSTSTPTTSGARRASTAVADDVKPRAFEDIPGPVALPLIGTLWQLFPIVGVKRDLNKAHDKFTTDFKKYGPIFRWKIPAIGRMVILGEPEDFETMRLLEEKYPTRAILGPIKHYRLKLSKHKFPHSGVLIENGDQWYRLRTKYQARLMKPRSALQYLDEMQAVADDFIDRIRLIRNESNNEMPEDFQNEFYRWALESVSCFALNTRLGCLNPNLSPDSDAQKMITATNESFDALNITENNFPLWKIWPTPAFKRLVAAQDIFTEVSLKHIKRALEDLDAKKMDKSSADEATVLEMLLTRDNVTQKDVLLLILDLLMAGIDTTSHSMGFLLYQLARNPDKQAILREEIDRVIGDKAKPVTAKALNSLSYLKACIKESMRMQPVAIGIMREFATDVVIRDYLIPAGTRVFAMRFSACMNPKYFPEPNKFIPERWVRGEAERENLHPMAHVASMPFGHGTRMCLGRRFAEQEMWLLTSKLVQNFDIQYHHEDIEMQSRLVIVPDKPLKFQFNDR